VIVQYLEGPGSHPLATDKTEKNDAAQPEKHGALSTPVTSPTKSRS